ncbi:MULTISPECIES: metallophosphoesterase [unclassified Paludibacterium]|uniref:metallophosphoesterase n=1 Tax=unclassified Paludibacterium TaxID=2618429 RepID=UPI001C05BD28|nr:metallophosphoesterase [Paludibacterium sp. B53371]BEV72333.1 metallophosphoesterase [Paludibacterium sp. THUN1379]
MPPRRVILSFLLLSALLHLYIGLRLLSAPGPVSLALLLLSVLVVPFSLLLRSIRWPALADALSWIGLSWFGLFALTLSLTALRDVALLAIRLVHPDWLASFSPDSATAVIWLSPLLLLVGMAGARRVARVRQVTVPIAGLPPELEGLRIAQLSDIHVGPTIKRGYLARMVARTNALGADVIAITGDVVDGSVRQLAGHTRPLADLQAPQGVYLVTGNHEYYSGAREWIAEFRRLGLTVLENQHVVLPRGSRSWVLAGVTDYSAGHFEGGVASDPQAALAGAPAEAALRVLLAHQPRSAPAAQAAGFDLQLSGHTHGGQFVPWNWLVPLQQPFVAGLHRLGDLWVYTSRGTGYWGPPVRLFAPSEITLLRLTRA